MRNKSQRILLSLGGGTFLGMIAAIVHELILRVVSLPPQIVNVIIANLITGLIGSLLWWVLLTTEARKLETHQELNDRVRNALQPILYSTIWVESKQYREVVVGGCYKILEVLNQEIELDQTVFPQKVPKSQQATMSALRVRPEESPSPR